MSEQLNPDYAEERQRYDLIRTRIDADLTAMDISDKIAHALAITTGFIPREDDLTIVCREPLWDNDKKEDDEFNLIVGWEYFVGFESEEADKIDLLPISAEMGSGPIYFGYEVFNEDDSRYVLSCVERLVDVKRKGELPHLRPNLLDWRQHEEEIYSVE